MRKVFIVGNWKCNNTFQQAKSTTETIVDRLEFDSSQVVIAPIYLHLVTVKFIKKNQAIQVAAQNCSMSSYGSFTGQIAAEQIKDLNIKWVILGHPDRRTHFKETDDVIRKKVELALKNGLKIIFCLGQTLAEKNEKRSFEVLGNQLNAIKDVVDNWENIVLGYDPMWVIEVKKNATVSQVEEIHDWIRAYLDKIGKQTKSTRIIYGGGVNQHNCKEFLKLQNVDGFLVGSNSMRPAFIDIVNSARIKFD